jgi:predicted enzyme related to lactoylglutathione lyase
MAHRSEYAPGTPSWVDLGADIDGAKKFYGTLFGWATQDAGPPEETGGYGFFMKGDKMAAGYGPQQNPGPPFWSTYVSVADAEQTAKQVEAAGGAVIVAPMDVMAAGRMAVFQDPQGGFVSAWQPGEHHGAGVVNEPGAFCWNELQSRDVDGSKAFYASVFGWEPVTHTDGPMPYTEFLLDGRSIAGMMPMPPMVPAEVPTYWLVYFAVDDCDQATAKARELGGTELVPPMDVPIGRFSVLTDAQGAVFAAIKLNELPD